MTSTADDYAELITSNAVITFCIFVMSLFAFGQKVLKMIRGKPKTELDEEIGELLELVTSLRDKEKHSFDHRRIKATHRNVRALCKKLDVETYSNSDSVRS